MAARRNQSISWHELAKGAYNSYAGSKAKPFGNLPVEDQKAWEATVRFVVKTMNLNQDALDAATEQQPEVEPAPEGEIQR